MIKDKPVVIKELEDLILQATKERSHYYVKSVAEKAILSIGMLIGEVERLEEKIREAIVVLDDFKPQLADKLRKTIGNLTKPERCPCGGIILADTEDWDIPLCYECFLAAEGLEQTELLKTTKGER